MNNKVRVVLIIIVIFSLIGLLTFAGFNVFKEKKTKNKKDNKTYEAKELVNITDNHCDNGYCISDYSYNSLENGQFEFVYTFTNNNENVLDKGCFRMVFSEIDNYVTCFEKIESGDVVKNVLVLEDDYYSEYTDYKVETLIGDELEFHYNEYVKNINYESDSNS